MSRDWLGWIATGYTEKIQNKKSDTGVKHPFLECRLSARWVRLIQTEASCLPRLKRCMVLLPHTARCTPYTPEYNPELCIQLNYTIDISSNSLRPNPTKVVLRVAPECSRGGQTTRPREGGEWAIPCNELQVAVYNEISRNRICTCMRCTSNGRQGTC